MPPFTATLEIEKVDHVRQVVVPSGRTDGVPRALGRAANENR
jgi:hypothetical protein